MARWRKTPDTIVHDGQALSYELVRRPRVTRNVYLELADDGGLRVVAPRRMSGRAVHRSLQSRSGEVIRFLDRARAARRDQPVFRYERGEAHPYMGKPLPLVLRARGVAPSHEFDGAGIEIAVRDERPETVRQALRQWYRQRAEEHFAKRLQYYCAVAPWTDGRTAPLRLRRMKRTMGSCSRDGVITLNPYLVKAPPKLIDYVVAHEVCHLAEHNHSKRFYALLGGLYPDWRPAQARLRADWPRYRTE